MQNDDTKGEACTGSTGDVGGHAFFLTDRPVVDPDGDEFSVFWTDKDRARRASRRRRRRPAASTPGRSTTEQLPVVTTTSSRVIQPADENHRRWPGRSVAGRSVARQFSLAVVAVALVAALVTMARPDSSSQITAGTGTTGSTGTTTTTAAGYRFRPPAAPSADQLRSSGAPTARTTVAPSPGEEAATSTEALAGIEAINPSTSTSPTYTGSSVAGSIAAYASGSGLPSLPASSAAPSSAVAPRNTVTTARPTSSTVRPTSSTVRPATSTTRPATSTTRPATSTTRPATSTTRPTPSTTRPTTTPTTSGPDGSCWNLVLHDDFNGSSVNTAVWEPYYSAGHAGNGLRRPSALSVGNGMLTITGQMIDGQIVSGGMSHRHHQMYGRYEVRARTDADPTETMSGVALTWPSSNNFPQEGENDFYETTAVPGDRHQFYTFIHKPYGRSTDQQYIIHRASATEWQTITMEWLPDRITIYRNGVHVRTIDETSADLIPDFRHFAALQLDTKRSGSTLQGPVRMNVDYITVWSTC